MRRLNYIDALRGFAIFVVMYCHIYGFGMKLDYESNILKFMTSVFIPLFFFLSGFVAYREKQSWSMKDTWAYIWKKTQALFIPSVVLVVFGSFYYRGGDLETIYRCFTKGLNGCGLAWFTFTLFLMFLIYSGVLVIASIFINYKKILTMLYACDGCCDFLSIV